MQDLINKIHHADCLEFMKQLPDKCIDLVLTDPPYFRIVAQEWDRQWKSIFDFQAWCGVIGKELQRVMKDNAALYWFGDDKTIAYCQTELDKTFALVNSLVWQKPATLAVKGYATNRSFACVSERVLFYEQQNAAGLPATGLKQIHSRPDLFLSVKTYLRQERDKLMQAKGFKTKKETHDFLSQHLGHCSHSHYFADSQFIIPNAQNYAKLQETGFFRREYEDLRREYEDLRREWNPTPEATDVLTYNLAPAQIHPTQKPVPLISFLMERASRPGALVFDPFAGSGTTAVAAYRLGRRFICCEKDKEYHAAASKRIEEEMKQSMLNF